MLSGENSCLERIRNFNSYDRSISYYVRLDQFFSQQNGERVLKIGTHEGYINMIQNSLILHKVVPGTSELKVKFTTGARIHHPNTFYTRKIHPRQSYTEKVIF